MALSDNAVALLEKRYLLPDEDPDGMFWRVAKAVASAESDEFRPDTKVSDRTYWEGRFFQAMRDLDFLPNSPLLMQAGTKRPQFLACFVLPVEDSINGIYDAVKNAAVIFQAAGGVGFSFSRLRPAGSPVMAAGGFASGPCSFMLNFNAMAETVKQGGRRRGAMLGLLDCWHPDIFTFLSLKEKEGTMNNFNLSVGITDDFMLAVEADASFPLINPHDGKVVRTIKARELWDQIVEHTWANGEPGVVFLDTVNKYNPLPEFGPIEGCNPCGEEPMPPYGSCVLGSINLTHIVRSTITQKNKIDWDRLGELVELGTRFLDDVIDVNQYPLEQIKSVALEQRRIGLGVMGFADMLYQLGVKYDSEEGLELGRELSKFIYERALETSIALAEEKGPYAGYRDGMPYRRNGTLTTVAPTGSISTIAGCSSGIEPNFALAYVRTTNEGIKLEQVNQQFINHLAQWPMEKMANDLIIEQIKRDGKLNGQRDSVDPEHIFVTSSEISPEWHVRMQAAWQEHIDAAISKTINMPKEATREDVANAIMSAWKLGCKGLTIYRDGSRTEQVLTRGTKEEETGTLQPRQRPVVTKGATTRVETGCGKAYVTVNTDEEGLCEVFFHMGKSGDCVRAQLEAVARLASLALRAGVAPEAIIKQLKGIKCPNKAFGQHDGAESCADALAKVLEGVTGITVEIASHDGMCPECGKVLRRESGCASCSCGYARC